MIKSLFSLLIISLPVFASDVPQAAIDMIARKELHLQRDRFTAKVNCSVGESPLCNSNGFSAHTQYAGAMNSMNEVICGVKPGETNNLGVTDQWKCLNKWQEMRNELWKKKHEEFFTQFPYLTKDYFSLKDKYPKSVVSADEVHYQIKDSYFVNGKCLAFNVECSRHLRISIERVTSYLEDISCSYPGKANRTRHKVQLVYPDQASAQDCKSFYREALLKGFQKMESSGYTSDDSDKEFLERVVNNSNLRTDSFLKYLYEDLRNILRDYPDVNKPEFASSPYLLILKRTLDKLGPEIKKIDPSFDSTYPPIQVDSSSVALLPVKAIELYEGEVKQPIAVQEFFRSQPNVISEKFSIKGDYLPPGFSYIEVKGQNGNASKIEWVYNQYKNGQIYLIPEAKLLEGKAESSTEVAATSTQAQAPTQAQDPATAPAEVSLHELATLHAKIEISNDLNCRENSSSRGCAYYKEYLTQTLPSQLTLLCKNETCNQEYAKYQASIKESLKSSLFPELESMVKAGAFVDPFKASEALDGAMKGQEAFNKVLRPVLSKYLPASEIKLLPSGVSPEITSAKVCSTSQQEETGGNQSSCLSATKEILTKIQKGTNIKRSAEVRGMPSLKALQGISSSIGSKSPERVQTNNQISQRESKASVSAESASSAARASVDAESGSRVMPSTQKPKHKLSPKELEAEAKKAAEIFN